MDKVKENQNNNEVVNSKWTKKQKIVFFSILIIAFLILLGRIFIFSTFLVPSKSMEDTILPSDNIIGEKITYQQRTPRQGEIVIFTTDICYIKRVIAVEGQTIDMKDGDVYIDGQKLNEPYVKGKSYVPENSKIVYPYTIPQNKLFVMGDNREDSIDSRYMNVIDVHNIDAKPVIIIFPFDRFGKTF